MANEDKNSILAWPKRVAQSIAFGAIDAVKETMPTMFSTVENNKEAAKHIYQELLGSRQQLSKLKTIQDTYIFKPAKELIKNLKSDLKSGVFYHPERAAKAEEESTKALMSNLLKEAGMEDLMGMLSGEEELTETEMQDMPVTPVAEMTSGDAFVATTIAQEQRYATNSLAKVQSDIAEAQMHTARTLGNMNLRSIERYTNITQRGFEAMIQGFNNIGEFHNSVIFKHVENSTQYYETMTKLTQENNAILKEMVDMKRNQYKAAQEENDPNKAPNKSELFKNGVFDLSTYIRLVESNIGGIEMIQMIPAMVQGFIAGIVANPMQFLTKQAVSMALGPGLRLAMKKFDRSITGYISTGLAKLGDFGRDPTNGILGYIGKIFGISTENVDINKSLVKDIKQPRSWDGEDHFYLTKVIPSYLSNIESALTGTEARIFNSTTGKFTTAAGIKRKFEQNEQRLANGNTYELTESMKNIIHSNINFDDNDIESIKRINEAIQDFSMAIQQKGRLNKVEDILTDPSFGQNANMRKILYSAVVAAAEQDPSIIARMNDNVIQSKHAEYQRRTTGEGLTDEEKFMATGSQNLFVNGGRAVEIGTIPKINTTNPLTSTNSDTSVTNSLISWQEKIHKVLTEIRDNGLKTSGDIIDSITNSIGGITGTNKDKTKESADNTTTTTSNIDTTDYGNRSVKSMVAISTDPLDPLRLAIKYESLREFYQSSDYRDNLDYWFNENGPTNYLKTVEQYIIHRDDLDKVDNGFGQYDQMRQFHQMKFMGMDPNYNTLSTKETTTKELESNDAAADEMANHILANKDKTAEIVRQRQAMFERSFIEDFLSDTYPLDRAQQIQKYKGDPNKSILENIAMATEIGDKIGLISLGISEIANAPRAMLTSVLHTADKMMYEFMFGKNNGEDGEIQGLFGKMTSKMDEAGQTLNDSISKVADTISKNQKQWLDKGLEFFKERFGIDIKGTYDKLKTTVKNFFQPTADKAKEASSSFISDITGSVKGTFSDIKNALGFKDNDEEQKEEDNTTPQHAFGSPSIKDGELAIVSKGESILYPKFNPFNKYRDNMPDVGSMGVPNITKTGLTYLPRGSAVIPSNINPWNPNRDTARPEQDILNENRIQEKLDSHVPNYAVGSPVTGDQMAGVLSNVLSNLDTEDLEGVLSLLAQHLNLKNQDDTTSILGELSGMGAKQLADFADLTPKNREFLLSIFKSLWKSKITRNNAQLKDYLRNAARAAGYTEKLETEDELIYEDYNKGEGIINGTSQFLMQMTGKDPEKAIEETKRYIIHNTPEMMKGGMAGALAGTIFPLGGPIMGAVSGVITSLLSRNKSFMNYIFGNELADGTRDESGLVSYKFMQSLQKYIPDIKKYGITGTLIGLVTPFGPLGGLMAGIAASYVKNNEAANRFLFGGDEDTHSGLFSKDLRNKIKRAMPNIGAATLSALFLGPFGIAGNAALGAGIGLLSTTETFKKIMLGAKDKNGIRHGGLAGAIRRHIVNPLKRNFKDWVKDIGKWFKQDLVRPISRAIGPITRYVGNVVKDTTREIFYAIREKVAGPGSFFDKLFNRVFYSIKKAGGIGAWFAKGIIGGFGSLLGKGIGFLGDLARGKNYEKGNSGNETAAEVVENMKKMNSTDDRTFNMYKNIADLKRESGMGVLRQDVRTAKGLAWAFGHEGNVALKQAQSNAYGHLTSSINEATLDNKKLEDHHVDFLKFAERIPKAESEAQLNRIIEDLKHYLKRENIVGEDYKQIMEIFYKNIEEIRLTKAAEVMRNEGLESHQAGITQLKNTYGFHNISDKQFVDKFLVPLSKALENEERLSAAFKAASEQEQAELGHEARSDIIEGQETAQSKAMEAYRNKIATSIEMTNELLAAGFFGFEPGIISTVMNSNYALDRAKMKAILKRTQNTIGYHRREDEARRMMDDQELYDKAIALRATETIEDLNEEHLRQIIGGNNRQYTAQLIKLGEARKQGNDAVVESLQYILDLDTKDDGKLMERIAALTISGLTVPTEQYEVINDLTETGFKCALKLVQLGCTIGDFTLFKRFDENDEYEANLMVEIAKHEYTLRDTDGSGLKQLKGSDFLTAEVIARNTYTKEGISARAVAGGEQAFIENNLNDYFNNYSDRYTVRDYEVGYAMRKSDNNTLTEDQLNKLNKITADSSEVSQVTGRHKGLFGLAQSFGDFTENTVRKAVNTTTDALEYTGDLITGGKTGRRLGRDIRDVAYGAYRSIEDKEYRHKARNANVQYLLTILGIKAKDKVLSILGDNLDLVVKDSMSNPKHILLYKDMIQNILNGSASVFEVPEYIQSIIRGIDPFGKRDVNRIAEEDIVQNVDGSIAGGTITRAQDDPTLRAYGTAFAGKDISKYAGGSFFSTMKNVGIGWFMGKDNEKKNKEEDKDSTIEPTLDESTINKTTKIMDTLAAATEATALNNTIFNTNNSPMDSNISLQSNSDNIQFVNTPYGLLKLVRSSVDGDWMVAPGKNNNEIQAKMDKDTELKEKIANSIIEMNTNLKDGLLGAGKSVAKKAGGGLLSLFKDVVDLPGNILSGLANALFAIPIIGGLAKVILTPIAGFFGKVKSAIFGTAESAVKGAGKEGAKAAGKLTNKLIQSGIPGPAKFMLMALAALLGFSLVPSSAEASDDIIYDSNGNPIPSTSGQGSGGTGSRSSSSSTTNSGILNFIGNHTVETGLLGLTGIGALTNILSNQKGINLQNKEIEKLEQYLAKVQGKAGKEKTVEVLEKKLTEARTAVAEAKLNTPLAKMEKFFPNPATFAKRNPVVAAILLAAATGTGYLGKTIYDDSNFGRYGSVEKDILGTKEHEYDPTKHGFKGYFTPQMQNRADRMKQEGLSDEAITNYFKDEEKTQGDLLYERRTKNDDRWDETKSTASGVYDWLIQKPKSLMISNMYDFAIRGLTGHDLGSRKHSLISGTAKTVGDIISGNKELDASTLGELAWNIGFTHSTNNLSNMIWDASNASQQRRNAELIEVLRNNKNNPIVKNAKAAIDAQFNPRIQDAIKNGETKLAEILVRKRDAALLEASESFLKQTGQTLAADSTGNKVQRALGKPIGLIRQALGTKPGKAVAVAGLGTYLYHSWNKAVASPEELKEINIKEAQEKKAKIDEEKRLQSLPRLKKGEEVIQDEVTGEHYLQLADGQWKKITAQQYKDYQDAKEYDRSHGKGIINEIGNTIESIPAIGGFLDRGFLANLAMNKFITKNNKILGGGIARLLMDAASGKEIDADRIREEMINSLEFRGWGKAWDYLFNRAPGQSIAGAMGQDLRALGNIPLSPIESAKQFGRNLKDSGKNALNLGKRIANLIPGVHFDVGTPTGPNLDSTIPKELGLYEHFELEEKRMNAYKEIERMKSYGLTDEQIKNTARGKQLYSIIESTEETLQKHGQKLELTESQKAEIERAKNAENFRRAQEEQEKIRKAREEAISKNAENIKAREADKTKATTDIKALTKEQNALKEQLDAIKQSKQEIENEKSFKEQKGKITELEEQKAVAERKLRDQRTIAENNRVNVRDVWKNLTKEQRNAQLNTQQQLDARIREYQAEVNKLTEDISKQNAKYQNALNARTGQIDYTLGTKEQEKRLAEVTKQLEERNKQLTQIEEQLKTQYAERDKLKPIQSEASKAANEKAIKDYQAQRERIVNTQNTPRTTTSVSTTITRQPQPSIIRRYSAIEIARMQLREDSLQALKDLPLDRREVAITERNSFLQAQIKNLSNKGLVNLTEGERQQLKSYTEQIIDNKKLLEETKKDIQALERSQRVKPPTKSSLWERFTKSKVGTSLSKISKSGMFKSGLKLGVTSAVFMGIAGSDNVLHQPTDSTDEEIMQRELAPGLKIIKDKNGNLVVVDKDGKPLADQSAVSRKQPIIPPGTDIIYDENGHMVLVDSQTRQPVPDQTPVTANQNATDLLHATRTAQMAAGLTRAGVSALTKFDKTKSFGEAIEKKLAAANKAVFGKYADKEFKLMEKPKAFKDTMQEVTKTLNQAVDKAEIEKVSKAAAKETTSTVANKAEKAATEAAEENGKRKTIMKKMREAIDKVIEQVTSSSLCPKKWISSIKQMGVKLLELIAKPEIMQKLLRKLAQHTSAMAAGSVTFGIGTAILTGVFAIEGFYAGFTEPETLLKIPAGKATTGMKVFSAIVRALEAFPYIGIAMMLLNETGYIVRTLSAAGITDLFGFNEESLKALRKDTKQDSKGNTSTKTDSSSTKDEEKGVFQKIRDFFTFDPNQHKKDNTTQTSTSNPNKPKDETTNTQQSTEEKSWWQSLKDFFTFDPNAHKTQGKGVYGRGKYLQQSDADVANIPIMSGGRFSPTMNGKSAGCQITAANNAFRVLGMGITSSHAADMQFASQAGLFPNYDDGSIPQTSVILAHRHGLAARNVDAKTGLNMLDENTSMVAQVSASKLSSSARQAMGLPKGDYEHYITLKKGTNGISFIDPDDPSGVGREKRLPWSAVNALSNATAIRKPLPFGKGITDTTNNYSTSNVTNINHPTKLVPQYNTTNNINNYGTSVYNQNTINNNNIKDKIDEKDKYTQQLSITPKKDDQKKVAYTISTPNLKYGMGKQHSIDYNEYHYGKKNFFSSLWDGIKEVGKQIWDTVRAPFVQAFNIPSKTIKPIDQPQTTVAHPIQDNNTTQQTEEPVTDIQAPNGKLVTKNDWDYLINQGYTENDAKELLFAHDKYREVKDIQETSSKIEPNTQQSSTSSTTTQPHSSKPAIQKQQKPIYKPKPATLNDRRAEMNVKRKALIDSLGIDPVQNHTVFVPKSDKDKVISNTLNKHKQQGKGLYGRFIMPMTQTQYEEAHNARAAGVDKDKVDAIAYSNPNVELEDQPQEIQNKVEQLSQPVTSTPDAPIDSQAPANLPYFKMWDDRWGDKVYPGGSNNTIRWCGCGPTSLAMVATWATGQAHYPDQVAEWLGTHGQHVEGGTADTAYSKYAKEYGFDFEQTTSWDEAEKALKANKPVINSQGPGLFTNNGHMITLAGIRDNGSLIVYNPSGEDKENSQVRFKVEEVTNTSANGYFIPKGANIGEGNAVASTNNNSVTNAIEGLLTPEQKSRKINQTIEMMQGKRAWGAFDTDLIGGSSSTSTSTNTISNVSDLPLGNVAIYAANALGNSHPELPWAQMMHETGGPDNMTKEQWQLEDHNYFGYKYYGDKPGLTASSVSCPPNEAGGARPYAKFDSDETAAKYWAETLQYYPGLKTASTPEEWANALKHRDDGAEYYEDSESNYAEGLRKWLNDPRYKDKLQNLGKGRYGKGFFSDLWNGIKHIGKQIWDTVRAPFVQAFNIPSKTIKPDIPQQDIVNEPVTDIQAPNGKLVTKNDWDYLINQGYSEEQAKRMLFDHDKYKQNADNYKISTTKSKPKIDELTNIKAPNGRYVSKPDLILLTDQGNSLESAKKILFSTDKYTQKLTQEITNKRLGKSINKEQEFGNLSGNKFGKFIPILPAVFLALRTLVTGLLRNPRAAVNFAYSVYRKGHVISDILNTADSVVSKAQAIYHLVTNQPEEVPMDLQPLELQAILWIADQLGFDTSLITDFLQNQSSQHFRLVYDRAKDYSNYVFGQGKPSYQTASIEQLQQDAKTIDWTTVEDYNKPDWENDTLSVLRSKISKVAKSNDTYLGAINLGKGNTMSVIGQLGPTCTIHSAKNILRAYTGQEPNFDPEDKRYFNLWYNMVSSDLQTDNKEYSKDQREQFEQDLSSHFAAKPNNPVLLYQTGGAGSGTHPINRVTGNHATIIGRKLSDGTYEDYDSNGPTIHKLQLNQIFDDTAKGSSGNGTDYNSSNILMIPRVDPSSPIDHWQSSERSAEPGAAPTSTTTGGSGGKPATKNTGIVGIISSLLQMMNIYGSPRNMASISNTTFSNTTSSGGASGDKMSEEQIWDWFRSKGYNAEATAGIMGRLKQENNFSPSYDKFQYVPGVGESGGMGIFQWTWGTGEGYNHPDLEEGRKVYPDSRLASYLDWCDQNHVPYESSSSQLNYLWEKDLNSQEHVLYTGYTFRPQEMNNMSAVEAAYHWTKHYERGQLGNEASYAKEFLEKYKDRPVENGKGLFGKGLSIDLQKDLNNLKHMDPIQAPNDVTSKAQSFWSSVENSKGPLGLGVYGRQYPNTTQIPTYKGNLGSNVSKDQIKDIINKHRKYEHREHYMSNKTEDELKAWNFLSKYLDPRVAAVLMSNMRGNNYTTYGQTDGSWGVFRLPAQFKQAYADYRKNYVGTRDTDEVIKEARFLASLVERQYAPIVQQMKGQNIATATTQWIQNVEPYNMRHLAERQERAKKIYETYYVNSKGLTTAEANYRSESDNSDMLGDAVDQEAVETATEAQENSTTSTANTAATTTKSNSGGLVGGLFDSIGNYFTGVNQAFNKFSSIIGNTVMGSPLGSMMKSLFGDNALSSFFFSDAMSISGKGKPIDEEDIYDDQYGKAVKNYNTNWYNKTEESKIEKVNREHYRKPSHISLDKNRKPKTYNPLPKRSTSTTFTTPIAAIPSYQTPTFQTTSATIPTYTSTTTDTIKAQMKDRQAKREAELAQMEQMLNTKPKETHIETESIPSTEHKIDPKRVWDFFRSKGFTPLQTAGAMGNLDIESAGFMPHVWECDGKEYPNIAAALKATKDHPDTVKYGDGWGYGFAQWSSWNGNPRRDNLISFAKARGKTDGDWQTQLDFLLKEISEGQYASSQTWDAINQVNTPEEAADIFCDYVEAPTPEYAHKDWREASARQFYEQFGKGKGIYGKALSNDSIKQKVIELQQSDEWNEIPDYNKPDIENDSMDIIESKLNAIDLIKKNKVVNKFISIAKKTANRIMTAKNKALNLNKVIESSTDSIKQQPIEEPIKQLQQRHTNFIESQKTTQDNITKQPITTNIADSKQVDQLIQEQQKTNSLLEKLIEAIMNSGQSIQDSIMNSASTSQNPFSVANAISSPRQQQGSKYGAGPIAMNQNKGDILTFLNNARSSSR